MSFHILRWTYCASLSVLLIGCTEHRPSGTYVARVNDSFLTTDDLHAHTDTSSVSISQVEAYVNRWVSRELLFQEARRRGLDRSPEVKEKIGEIEKQLIVSQLLDREIYGDDLLELPNDELLQYFNEHTQEFILENDVATLNYMLFEERELANTFRSRVVRNTPWYDAVAAVESDTAVASGIISRGDSLYITEQDLLAPAVWRTATKMGAGQVSYPLKTDQGYFVLQLTGFQKRGTPAEFRYSLPEIRERLIVEKRRRRLESLLTELRQHFIVEVNLEEPSEEDTLHDAQGD